MRPERERNAYKRAWDQANDRRPCPCGALRGIGKHRENPNGLCAACRRDVVVIGQAMRDERIAELWADGLTQKQIAARLGGSRSSINASMVRMRHAGWDLPYRHHWTPEGLARARQARARAAA